MIDWKNLKSAVEITDPDEAFAKLRAAFDAKNGAPVGRKGHTYISRTKDGSVAISKQTSLVVSGDGAPAAKSPEELYALILARGVGKGIDGSNPDKSIVDRVVPYWASDERVDAHGDIVKQTWHFDEFSKNPVMPFGHLWGETPVGTYLEWLVLMRKSLDYVGPGLWLLGLYADDEKSTGVLRLVKGGFLKAASVGFASKKLIDVKDDDERAALGLGRYGYILDENHLLENSPVTIGANPGALSILSRMRAQNAIAEKDFLLIRELQRRQVVRGFGDKDAWAEEDRKTIAMCKMLFPETDMRAHANLDEPIVGASPTEDELLRNYRPPSLSLLTKAAIKKGDKVRVKGKPHMVGQKSGTVEIANGGPAVGIIFEGMEDMGVHKWYVPSELEVIDEDGKAICCADEAIDRDIVSIIASMNDQRALVEHVALGIQAQLDDVRTLLEQLTDEKAAKADSDDPAPQGEKPGGKEASKTGEAEPKVSLLRRAFQRRDELKQNS